ncbi:hypothetical protein C8F04DRAFT_1089185 [Mycena alexandri]|uniref:Uncharacterized protein n=1 Tax=Mycena alexandri TaxID=1745969 RepID=A0AAD6X6I0_9AGAR|nr:hypothetical protein C8F04DRAFT_1089185 [Mycena alexandri]
MSRRRLTTCFTFLSSTSQSGEMTLLAAVASLAPSSTGIAANVPHVLSLRSHTPNESSSESDSAKTRPSHPAIRATRYRVDRIRAVGGVPPTYVRICARRSRGRQSPQFRLPRCALLLRHCLPLSCDTPAHLQARLSTFSAAAYRIAHASRDRVTRIGLARASASCAPPARRGRAGREYGSGSI